MNVPTQLILRALHTHTQRNVVFTRRESRPVRKRVENVTYLAVFFLVGHVTPQISDFIVGRIAGKRLSNLKLLLSPILSMSFAKLPANHRQLYSCPNTKFRIFRLLITV